MAVDVGIPRDTGLAAATAQVLAWRSLSGPDKVAISFELSAAAFQISRAGLGSRHPEYSSDEVELALRRLVLGDEVFVRAYPEAPLLDP